MTVPKARKIKPSSMATGDMMNQDALRGVVLVACSLVLFPVSLDLMQEWDDLEREYERECDPQYRALTGNISSPDKALCDQLADGRPTALVAFAGSLTLFVVTGVVGLTMIMPDFNSE